MSVTHVICYAENIRANGVLEGQTLACIGVATNCRSKQVVNLRSPMQVYKMEKMDQHGKHTAPSLGSPNALLASESPRSLEQMEP